MRSFAATPMKLSRVARVVTSPSTRASSALGSTPVGARGPTSSSQGSSRLSTASRVQPEVQVEFQKQNGSVSNLVMPEEALLIASNSIAKSTRSKYKSVFNRFIV